MNSLAHNTLPIQLSQCGFYCFCAWALISVQSGGAESVIHEMTITTLASTSKSTVLAFWSFIIVWWLRLLLLVAWAISCKCLRTDTYRSVFKKSLLAVSSVYSKVGMAQICPAHLHIWGRLNKALLAPPCCHHTGQSCLVTGGKAVYFFASRALFHSNRLLFIHNCQPTFGKYCYRSAPSIWMALQTWVLVPKLYSWLSTMPDSNGLQSTSSRISSYIGTRLTVKHMVVYSQWLVFHLAVNVSNRCSRCSLSEWFQRRKVCWD